MLLYLYIISLLSNSNTFNIWLLLASSNFFECSFDGCQKKFYDKTAFHKHQLTHGDKLFTCGDCGKKFLDNSKLKRHSLVHTGEKPFKCEICNKSYLSAPALIAHKKTKHGFVIEGEKKGRGRPRKDNINNNASINNSKKKYENFFNVEKEEYDKASKMLEVIPEEDEYLEEIGNKFLGLGMYDEAVIAFTKRGNNFCKK